MKNIKLLVVLVALSSITFFSCTDNKSIEESAVVPTKSVSLRTHLSKMKINHNILGKNATSDTFAFLFPVTFSYSDGTTVTVDTNQALLDLLANETQTLYLDGIAFPFQINIANGNTTSTVPNEDEYESVLANNNIPTVNYIATQSTCFDFIFPISVIDQNNQPVVINNQTELVNFSNSNNPINFVYPFSVIAIDGQVTTTVNVDNLYEFLALNICN
jgi:hypothetical protein